MEEKKRTKYLYLPGNPENLVRLVWIQRIGEGDESESKTEKKCIAMVGVSDPGVSRRGRRWYRRWG
jgi:hypothetical protein